LEEFYPEVWPKVSPWKEQLQTTPWAEVEKLAPFNFLEVSFKGREVDDNYISAARLAARPGTFLEIRSFLYFEIGLKELFKGDGYAYSQSGERGTAEFLAPNRPVSELQHAFHELVFDFTN